MCRKTSIRNCRKSIISPRLGRPGRRRGGKIRDRWRLGKADVAVDFAGPPVLSALVPRGPLILLTNDDGVDAPGLRALEAALGHLGEVWTVAPAHERSTSSHSVTLGSPLFVLRAARRRFAVSGTPVDALFVGLGCLLPRRPALVVSGINVGPNLGTDTIYSGTVAAAREAALRGIPAVAVSLVRGSDWTAAARPAAEVVRLVLRAGRAAISADGRGALLNLNVPAHPRGGIRLTRLGRRTYPEEVELRRSPRGGMYAWIGGYPVGSDRTPGTDTRAVSDGFVSATLLTMDLTQRDARDRFPALLDDLEALAPRRPAASRRPARGASGPRGVVPRRGARPTPAKPGAGGRP
jgi:5'-nucleotidase